MHTITININNDQWLTPIIPTLRKLSYEIVYMIENNNRWWESYVADI